LYVKLFNSLSSIYCKICGDIDCRVRLVTGKMEYNPESVSIFKAINPEKIPF
jgi:hypothetical protein